MLRSSKNHTKYSKSKLRITIKVIRVKLKIKWLGKIVTEKRLRNRRIKTPVLA